MIPAAMKRLTQGIVTPIIMTEEQVETRPNELIFPNTYSKCFKGEIDM